MNRQSRRKRRGMPGYLKEVLEPEVTTITVQCQRCKKEATAVRYRLKVKDLPDEDIQRFRRVVTPHIAQWLRPPPGWWACEEPWTALNGGRVVEGSPPVGLPGPVGAMTEPLRCEDCMAEAGSELNAEIPK